MDLTNESDSEDSFHPKMSSLQRGKAAAIIDSETDSDDEEVAGSAIIYSSDDDSVEDSFEEEEEQLTNSMMNVSIEKTPRNNHSVNRNSEQLNNVDHSIENSESDEEEKRNPEIDEDEDLIENSTDDEAAATPLKKSLDFIETTDDDDVGPDSIPESVPNIDRPETPQISADDSDNDEGRENIIINNSQYRETNKTSDDENSEADAISRSVSPSSDDNPVLVEKTVSVLEISSDDESNPVTLKQSNIKSFFLTNQPPQIKEEAQPQNAKKVSRAVYEEQVKRIQSIENDLHKTKNALRIVKLENLPDKGKSILEREVALNRKLIEETKVLDNMEIDDTKNEGARDKIEIAWDQIEAGVDAVGPRTFGKKGVARFNAEKQLAVETLDSLHKSLDTCPTENDFAEDPNGLKIPLMPHQKRALAWLLWREKQKPSGGLLADDMGLGKTLTMISLIIKCQDLESNDEIGKENYRDKYPGGTLVVCPASLLNQWSGEIEKRTKRGLLGVEVHHGPNRETKAKRLAKHDVVVTTYSLVLSESDKSGTLFGVRWRRIILDEAHQIRNHKSKTSEAIFRLSGKSRWALTGTPIQNKELDMYSILKFLRCSPFDDLQVWKHWVSDKSTGGDMRLHAVISSLMLRRTKAELMEKGSLKGLPERTWELVSVKLEQDEMDVYQKVLIFSRTLFAQFLHQRAEKNQDAVDFRFNGAPRDPNGEYFKMRNRLLKLNRVKEVSQHEILVLLLRLRQICCHPFLIKQMLQGDEDLGDADNGEDSEELNLLEQLNRLNMNDDDEYNPTQGLSEESVGLKEASKGFLNPSNPIFSQERASSKIKALVDRLKSKVSGEDKAIIVSQWTSLLELIALHIKIEGIPFDSLNGKIPVHKRSAVVDNFNDPNSNIKVLLLSLTAGGVGLNLVGANHLFLLDLHWNPQLENQAQDRIYRFGQNKPIYVYKFMAVDTIEERIKALQDRKLDIADSMLTGSKRVSNSKLTLQDLKLLFDFK